MTLTEFLLARIAEDEAAAEQSRDGNLDWFDSDHQMRWTPPRVLADCKAKRRIVERSRGTVDWPLYELAAIYADHPDYREEWRP